MEQETSKGKLKEKVEVWLYYRDPNSKEFLFLLLETTVKRGAFWQPVTGSVEKGEALASAALREAREETGIDLVGPAEPLGIFYDYEGWGQKYREHGFSLEVESESGYAPKVQLDAHEHQNFQWVTSETAQTMLKFPENEKILQVLVEKLRFT